MINRGYIESLVEIDTLFRPEKRTEVKYNIYAGDTHVIKSLNLNIPDSTVKRIIVMDMTFINVTLDDLFDRNSLDALRSKKTNKLHNEGYYTLVTIYEFTLLIKKV